jgi:outer membrane protein assembly factor BamE (lipoprotein component of BamABCDE complex)
MKNTTLLATLLCALALTACGGGDSSSPTSGDLPSGKVSTVGDGINATEFEAIQCGMNKDQVTAIVGDAPTSTLGELVWNYAVGSNYTQIEFTGSSTVKSKGTGPSGSARTVQINC